MFRISNAQLNALVAPRMEAFRVRLRQHLTKHFPETIARDEAAWADLLDFGLKNARAYQIKTEAGITIYFNALMSLGKGFAATYDWAQPLLHAANIRERDKIRRLINHVEAEL